MARLVLLHGGCHGAWCWEKVLAPLQAAGHHPEPVDLPGRGPDAGRAAEVTLEQYVATLVDAIEGGEHPVVLVAHSMGGQTAAALAELRPELLAGIVFVAALVPADGEAGLVILQQRAEGSRLLDEGAIVIAPDGATATIEPEAASEAFYFDCEPGDAAWGIDHLHPEPVAPMMTPLSLSAERWGSVPKAFVVTTEDRCVPPRLQRELAGTAGAEVLELASGHSPFVSQPEAFAALVAELAARVAPAVPEQPEHEDPAKW